MAIITITVLALAALGGAAIYFWNYIREALTTVFLPWLKNNFSYEIFNCISDFVLMLDSGITATRRGIKKGWEVFNNLILKRETKYETKHQWIVLKESVPHI